MLYAKSLVNYLFKYKRKVYQNVLKSGRRYNATSQPSKILFFGTDNFSLPSLQKLHHSKLNVGVVTSFKHPKNCVRIYAEQQRLPLYRWPISAELCASYELGIVVSFGHMIPSNIINAFPNGIINVHASLLPRWRGAAPIIYAIMNGDATTGISIMKIEPHKFDIGDILAQREIPIPNNVFMPELHSVLAELGAELLVNTVQNFADRFAKAQPQNDNFASYAPKITPAVTNIVWLEQNATELYARHRALYGFKSLTSQFLDKQVQLMELRLPGEQLVPSLAPGWFCFNRLRNSLIIGCAQDTQLEVLQVRIEGKKSLSARDFNNGFLRRTTLLQFMPNKQIVP